MASVDDLDELIATRRLNGLNDGLFESERNDVNVDIKILKKWLHELDCLFEQTKINNTKERTALRNALAEREADKKRIKELEEPKIIQDKNIRNGKPIIKGTRLTVIDVLLFIANFIKDHEKEFRENYADISLKQIIDSINYLLNNSIPKQKVKDKIDEINKKYEDSKDKNGESPYYYPEYTIRVLEKLLEEK